VVFDNWLWPDRAEPILIETLRASAARHHQRLAGATRFYLNARAAPRPEEPPRTSDLPQHLALLQRAVFEGLTAHRRAVLLAAITRLARIQIETDRLIIAVREDVPRQVRAMMRPEIERAVDAITAALDDMAHDASSLMRSGADRRLLRRGCRWMPSPRASIRPGASIAAGRAARRLPISHRL